MGEVNEKELGIFGLDWLGLENLLNSDEWKFQFHSTNWLLNPKNLFDDDFGPILAHLAKRKMEDMGYNLILVTDNKVAPKYKYSWTISKAQFGHPDFYWGDYSSKDNENEYIALWLAIRSAIGEKNKSDK